MGEMLKVFTTFSGYDSQCLALKYAGIDFDLVGWSEIDKYAIQAHDAIFPEYAGRNYGDITKIDWSNVPDFDFLTYSSPCQDISLAGQQRGLKKGSETRSSLLWEIEKAVEIKKPRFLLMENVANLVSDKFIGDFNKWLLTLEKHGYSNFWRVLNSKNYGVPQNRDRVFVVSIRGNNVPFYWPEPKKLDHHLADILEKNVDERYFLKYESVEKLIGQAERQQKKGNGFKFEPKGPDSIVSTITTRYGCNTSNFYLKVDDENGKPDYPSDN